MTTSQITGGTVKHTDPSNYQNGKPGWEVTIHFSVRDNADEMEWQTMGDKARGEAKRIAEGGPPKTTEAVEQPAKLRGRPRAIPAEVPAANPTQIVQAATSDPAAVEPSATVSSLVDPAAITVDDTPSAPVEQSEIVITDVDMRNATNEAVAHKVTSAAITKMIVEFTNPPGTPEAERIPGHRMPEIEQGRRAEYLARLKALYANA